MKLLYSGNTLLEQWRPFPKELEQEQPVDLALAGGRRHRPPQPLGLYYNGTHSGIPTSSTRPSSS